MELGMRKSIQLIRTLLIVKMVTRKYKDATTGSVKGGLRFKRLRRWLGRSVINTAKTYSLGNFTPYFI